MQKKKMVVSGNGNGRQLPEKVGIIYSDVKKEYFPTEAQYLTEKDADEDARIIGSYLTAFGITVFLYAGNENLPFLLDQDKPELVINIVDSVNGNEALSFSIPRILESLDIPYTGADSVGLSYDTDKYLIKQFLQKNRIPVPNYQLIHTPGDPLDPNVKFPIISKLNAIHGAVEITRDSVCEDEKHLRDRLRFLIHTYRQPVLIEEFVAGREITAILVEGLDREVYLAEKVFLHCTDKYVFTTFEDQWMARGDTVFRYEKYDDPILTALVKKAFGAARMGDYGKFDVRLDSAGRYFFIDTNCNPAFGPKELDVALSVILDLYGISFEEILKQILLNTVRSPSSLERLPVLTEVER